jgi:type VI secretion system secreted protein Hcp
MSPAEDRRSARRRRALKLALPLVAVLGAGTAVAIAAIGPDSDGAIHACYPTTGSNAGALRIIDPTTTCATTEQSITWNQTGPTGPQGPQGDPGLPGGTDTGSGTDTTFGSTGGGPSASIFLKLDGIPGESTDDKHKGQIDLEAFAFVKHSAGGASGSSRGGSSLFRLDKVYDASSPKLLHAATRGQLIKSAEVSFDRSDSSAGGDFLTYKLSDVRISSYEQGGKDPDDKVLGSLEEEIGLTAAHYQVIERTTNGNGDRGPVVVESGNLRR